VAAQKNTDRHEYRLRVSPEFDELEQVHRTVVLCETTREFASFRYELGVEEEVSGTTLKYRITGLKAPQLSLPDSGPAYFRRSYTGLNGAIEILIEGLDKRTTSFVFDVTPTSVTLTSQPRESFVSVSTEPEHPS